MIVRTMYQKMTQGRKMAPPRETALYCPYHYGRIKLKDLSYSCQDGCFSRSTINEVLKKFHVDERVALSATPENILRLICQCPGGNKVRMYCNICEQTGAATNIDISNYLYLKGSEIIPILGPASSGKSVMLGCLYKVIEEYSLNWNFGFMVAPARAYGPFQEIYVEPMFPSNGNRPRLVDKTQIEERVEPFCFDLRPIERVSTWPGKPLRFVVYDPSGDALANPTSFANMEYVRESRLIIFLIDPECVSKLRENFLIPVSSRGSRSESLKETGQILVSLTGLKQGAPESRIIFVLTKTDAFFRDGPFENPFRRDRELGEISEKVRRMYFMDSPHGDRVNTKWMEEYSGLCKEFLKKADATLNSLINNAEAAAGEKGVDAFLISSLGTANVTSESQRLPGSDETIDIMFLDSRPTPRHIENIIFSCDHLRGDRK